MHDPRPVAVAIVGDVHGHLQLALCMVARWQEQLNVRFEAVLLCGDVGTFTDESELDGATRSHAKDNECELEFLRQWAVVPQAPWLANIFEPLGYGLGLTCPVVMVHGNHDGFAHLATLFSKNRRPAAPVPIEALRGVDTSEFIKYLPCGWQAVTPSGLVIGGVGGMQAGQRARTKYHPMAYINEDAVLSLVDAGPIDLLITHQGPTEVQGDHGAECLQILLDEGTARNWFHGHSTPVSEPCLAGRRDTTLVVPLGDIAFKGRGADRFNPGLDGWAYAIREGDTLRVVKETPPFWRELRLTQWGRSKDGRLVSPDLMPFTQGEIG